MYPLPINPTVVLQVSKDGKIVVRSASNIDPELKVVLVDNEYDFKAEAANKPFDSTRS